MKPAIKQKGIDGFLRPSAAAAWCHYSEEMMAKVFFAFLMVAYASLMFFSLEVVATKDEGPELECVLQNPELPFFSLNSLFLFLYITFCKL